MTVLINDENLETRLIAARQATGADRFDEVWDGVYMISPMANNEHQEIVKNLTTVLTIVVDWKGLGEVYPGVNVSDRTDDWESNYRCPDVAVFLKCTRAKNCGTHWHGGPDFAVEVVSPNDHTFQKTGFCAAAGTRELLIVDRDPWQLSLLRRENDALIEAGRSTVAGGESLPSDTVPLA